MNAFGGPVRGLIGGDGRLLLAKKGTKEADEAGHEYGDHDA
jgi:hypothetical protein